MSPHSPSCSVSFWFCLVLFSCNSPNLSVRPGCGWGRGWVRHIGSPTLWGQWTSGPEKSKSGNHPQEAGSGSTQPGASNALDLKNGQWVTRVLGALQQTVEDKVRRGQEQADGGLGSSPSLRHLQSLLGGRYALGSLPQVLWQQCWEGKNLGRALSLGYGPWHSAHCGFPSVFCSLCSLTVHRHGGFVDDAHHGLPGGPAARVGLRERVCHCGCGILYGICDR